MKLQLILPRTVRLSILDHRSIAEFMEDRAWLAPLPLATIAALTPEGVEISIVDENIEQIDFNANVDLVGISVFTSSAVRAYEIADKFRKSGVKVVLGGIHPSALPEEAICHADAVVIGEAEGVWKEVISDFQKGKLRRFYKASFREDLKKPLIPRWDLIKLDSYRAFAIQTTRGCPFNCSFCSVKVFFGAEYRFKPIENVIEEIKALQRLKPRATLFFVDDNFAANPKRTQEFLAELSRLKIRNWVAQITINTEDRVLQSMAACGCSHVVVGLESLIQKTIDSMNKGAVNRVKTYSDVINKIHSYGMGVLASFIVGYDSEDKSIFDKIKKFVEDCNIEFPLVCSLTPFPGTAIAKQLLEENRIIDNDWRHYDCSLFCFKPKPESAAELSRMVIDTNKRFYAYGNLYNRLSKSWRKGIFTRTTSLGGYFFNRNRLKFSLYALRLKDIKRCWFMLKSLWHIPNPKFYTIFLSLNIHDILHKKMFIAPTGTYLKENHNGIRNRDS
ncbi:B12-binding domain-containing radical SAM protein [Candidatus Omnitrophota bacterium]